MGVYELYREAEACLRAGNPRQAVQALDEALLDAPGDTGLLRLQARALLAFAALGRAEEVLRGLLVRHPCDAELALLLAVTLRRQGRRDEAATQARLAHLLGAEVLQV